MLSYSDLINTNYGFDSKMSTYDTARIKQGTDYAKCQGLYTNSGNSTWTLRSAGNNVNASCGVRYLGTISDQSYINSVNLGVCPTLCLNLESSSFFCAKDGHTLGEGTITKNPTCTIAGIKTYTCEVCGEEFTEEIPALGHEYENGQCIRCEYIIGEFSLGDVNKDGKINAADMNYMVKIISGINETDDSTIMVSDVSGDGKITAVDMNMLSKYISGLIKSFANT